MALPAFQEWTQAGLAETSSSRSSRRCELRNGHGDCDRGLTGACESSLNRRRTPRVDATGEEFGHGHSRFTGKFAGIQGALGQLGAAVLPAVLSEVMGSGRQGGLSAIVAKLQQAGFGDQVKSWIGNGQNLPITADQLQQVLGSDAVRQLAARYNIPVDQVAEVLAQQLPAAVDKASPDGKLPHTA